MKNLILLLLLSLSLQAQDLYYDTMKVLIIYDVSKSGNYALQSGYLVNEMQITEKDENGVFIGAIITKIGEQYYSTKFTPLRTDHVVAAIRYEWAYVDPRKQEKKQ